MPRGVPERARKREIRIDPNITPADVPRVARAAIWGRAEELSVKVGGMPLQDAMWRACEDYVAGRLNATALPEPLEDALRDNPVSLFR